MRLKGIFFFYFLLKKKPKKQFKKKPIKAKTKKEKVLYMLPSLNCAVLYLGKIDGRNISTTELEEKLETFSC